LTVADPALSDGMVLTGFSHNGSFASYFLLGSNFVLANEIPGFGSYSTGYLAASLPGAQIDFFAPGNFDPQVLNISFASGQPVAPGEILTLAGLTATPNSFTGPALIITGGACPRGGRTHKGCH
jgi:hypothetical protein